MALHENGKNPWVRRNHPALNLLDHGCPVRKVAKNEVHSVPRLPPFLSDSPFEFDVVLRNFSDELLSISNYELHLDGKKQLWFTSRMLSASSPYSFNRRRVILVYYVLHAVTLNERRVQNDQIIVAPIALFHSERHRLKLWQQE